MIDNGRWFFFGGVEEDLPAFFLGKLGALIHFSTTRVLKNSLHLKHEIGWMGGNTSDIQEPSKKAMISYLLTKLFQICEAGPEEEVVLELPMGARSDGAFMGDTKTHLKRVALKVIPGVSRTFLKPCICTEQTYTFYKKQLFVSKILSGPLLTSLLRVALRASFALTCTCQN